MKEHYVSFECAQTLKRLGFDKKVSAVWHFDGEEWNLIPDYGAIFQHPKDIPPWNTSKAWGEFIYSAPRLDQAAAWMRELGALHINVYPAIPFNKWKFNLDDLGQSVNPTNGELNCRITEEMTEKFEDGWYDTYESALSAGLDAAIELLGKEVNNA